MNGRLPITLLPIKFRLITYLLGLNDYNYDYILLFVLSRVIVHCLAKLYVIELLHPLVGDHSFPLFPFTEARTSEEREALESDFKRARSRSGLLLDLSPCKHFVGYCTPMSLGSP